MKNCAYTLQSTSICILYVWWRLGLSIRGCVIKLTEISVKLGSFEIFHLHLRSKFVCYGFQQVQIEYFICFKRDTQDIFCTFRQKLCKCLNLTQKTIKIKIIQITLWRNSEGKLMLDVMVSLFVNLNLNRMRTSLLLHPVLPAENTRLTVTS